MVEENELALFLSQRETIMRVFSFSFLSLCLFFFFSYLNSPNESFFPLTRETFIPIFHHPLTVALIINIISYVEQSISLE